MKRIALLLSLCVCAFGTQITGPIKTPYGTGWSGDILIDCPSGVNAAGDVIRRWAMRVSVVNGGLKYMASLKKKYGEYPRALAAYNWGPGNLDRCLTVHGSDWRTFLPTETKNYLNKIL